MARQKRWWQKTTIYHIYPRSYKDSNNDGIGDIQGIISKLDYIRELGFETIWVSPFFSSPQQDWGYDVSDYINVAPEFGDLLGVEELIQQVHLREMRLLFDLVLNHTSVDHPWFQESRDSLDNPKRDWYIWRDGRGTGPPNNWKSIIGDSGWNYDPGTDQWYFASFLPFQPDLNYRNPEVVEEMVKNVKFWLDMGVDGFRLDIFHSLFKDVLFRNNPRSIQLIPHDFMGGYFQQWKYNLNQPETIEFARDLRALIDSYSPERMLLGEIFADDFTIKKYLGSDNEGLNLVFLWDLMDLRPKAGFLRNIIRHHESHYPEPYTPVYVFGNHDLQRLMTRIKGNKRIAALLALFQFTARGVPVTYYGEEIGMVDGMLPLATAKDPIGRRFRWVPGIILNSLKLYPNRDRCRTPMQWNAEENTGFCSPDADPWLPINPDFREVNVKNEHNDNNSLLNVYRELLRIRKVYKALNSGSLELAKDIEKDCQLLAYTRKYEQEIVLVLINYGRSDQKFRNHSKCKKIIFQIGKHKVSPMGDITLNSLSGLVLSN